MARRDQRNPFADEYGYDADDEFVDLVFVEKRSDDPAAAHHPDVFALLTTHASGKFLDWLVDEFETGQDFLWWPTTRKDIVSNLAAIVGYFYSFFDELHSHVVGLSSINNCIDGLEELAHAVVFALRPRPVEPINRAILARDKTVGAGGDGHDDLAFRHGGRSFTTEYTEEKPPNDL